MIYSSLQLTELRQDKADSQDVQIQSAATGNTISEGGAGSGVQNSQGTSPQNPPAHPAKPVKLTLVER